VKSIRRNNGVFAGSVEELILRIGLYLVILWLVVCIVAAWHAPHHCVGALKAVGYHALGGRAAGISAGLGAGLPIWLVVTVAFAMDTTIIFLLYPLVVYSYERGARRWFTRGTVESTIDAASSRRKGVARWGIAGIVFFVWFPFYMTGPLVGAVIGYFLALRPWVNLTAVSGGTLLAIVSWTFLFDWLLSMLKEVAAGLTGYVPLAVVVFVLLGVLAAHVLSRRKRAWARKATESTGRAEGGDPLRSL
jgi:uncharacterized membrane protein